MNLRETRFLPLPAEVSQASCNLYKFPPPFYFFTEKLLVESVWNFHWILSAVQKKNPAKFSDSFVEIFPRRMVLVILWPGGDDLGNVWITTLFGNRDVRRCGCKKGISWSRYLKIVSANLDFREETILWIFCNFSFQLCKIMKKIHQKFQRIPYNLL